MLPILQKQWHISDLQVSLLGSLVYLGYMAGSLLSGFIADRYGRKNPIIISSFVMFLLALAGAFMPEYISYTVLRMLLVACVGFIIPVAFSMLAENTPVKQRGVVLAIIGLFYTAGE